MNYRAFNLLDLFTPELITLCAPAIAAEKAISGGCTAPETTAPARARSI